ncbi:energy transducer TonB, partial [Novilysobacter arseniciresistens]|uniref:energy transducer TonB n=1 Tax=Novilysobacter arseniciresistens TaxID=1385522 RepID=UPI001269D9D9
PPAPLDAGVPVPPAPPAPPAAPPPPPGALPANRTPPPRYPAAAIEQGIEGAVVLVVEIDAEGRPLDVEVEKSEPAGVFDQAAIDAAMQWRFSPAVEDGKKVPGRVRVPIEFRSDGQTGETGA